MKKNRKIKMAMRTLTALLVAVVLVAGVLFFPLTGKKHIEIWSADQAFDSGNSDQLKKLAGRSVS